MNNGGYAFPVPMVVRPCGDGTTSVESVYDGGMTLRDYFAASAMRGLITAGYTDAEWIAERACIQSDIMLEKLGAKL